MGVRIEVRVDGEEAVVFEAVKRRFDPEAAELVRPLRETLPEEEWRFLAAWMRHRLDTYMREAVVELLTGSAIDLIPEDGPYSSEDWEARQRYFGICDLTPPVPPDGEPMAWELPRRLFEAAGEAVKLAFLERGWGSPFGAGTTDAA